MNSDSGALDVVGVGNALVDVISATSGTQLNALNLYEGAMTLVSKERAEAIYEAMGATTEMSGGSAANTVAAIAALGGAAGYVGKVADDELGRVFTHDMKASGVTFEPADAGDDGHLGTGRCLVLVSRDGARTMATYLGIASTVRPGELPAEFFSRGRILYLEGYLWDLPPAKEAMRRAARTVHDAGGSVALSLSDPFCVERHRRDFLDLLLGDVDVLLGNEEELVQLFAARSAEEALAAAEQTGLLVAMTRGAAGSVVVTAHGPVAVAAAPVDPVVDTTGAGDLFAAGFLYALTHGADPVEGARLGSLCAAEILGHFGARPERDLAAMARAAGLV